MGLCGGLLACCSYYVGTAVLTVWPALLEQAGEYACVLRWTKIELDGIHEREREEENESEIDGEKSKMERSQSSVTLACQVSHQSHYLWMI